MTIKLKLSYCTLQTRHDLLDPISGHRGLVRVAVVQEDMEANDWVPGDSRPDIEVHF
jgi:hypothetical protein